MMDPKNVKSMMQSIDTDMNGTVNYTGTHYLQIRILSSDTGRKRVPSRREAKTRIQQV